MRFAYSLRSGACNPRAMSIAHLLGYNFLTTVRRVNLGGCDVDRSEHCLQRRAKVDVHASLVPSRRGWGNTGPASTVFGCFGPYCDVTVTTGRSSSPRSSPSRATGLPPLPSPGWCWTAPIPICWPPPCLWFRHFRRFSSPRLLGRWPIATTGNASWSFARFCKGSSPLGFCSRRSSGSGLVSWPRLV
jgi:hypothetical protein